MDSVKVEIIKTKLARAGKPAAWPYKYIVRRYHATGGFTLLASGGPFKTEETARKHGEKAAAPHRIDFKVVLFDLAEGKEYACWEGLASALLRENGESEEVRAAVEALRAGAAFQDMGGGAAFTTRLRRSV